MFDVINIQSELVIATDPNQALLFAANDLQFNTPTSDKNSFRRLVGTNAQEVVELVAREPVVGTVDNPLSVDVISDPGGETVSLVIKSTGKTERFENVHMDPLSERYLVFKIQGTHTSLVTAVDLPANPDNPTLPDTVNEAELDGGTMPNLEAYQTAINRLEKDPSIDMVMASVQNVADLDFIKNVFWVWLLSADDKRLMQHPSKGNVDTL